MLKRLIATKSFDSIHAEHRGSELKRSLGPWQLTWLGVGGTIGTGIFVLTGLEAATHAGPAIVLSIIIAGIGCVFAGLCYAEFSAMAPVAGSAYTYTYATLGEFAAWFIGWDLLLEYMFAAGTVAVGWSRYFGAFLDLFGIHLPPELTAAPFTSPDGLSIVPSGAILNLPAMVIALLTAAVCYIGITQTSFVNTIIVLLKVAVIVLVIAFGMAFVNAEYWVPFIPENTGVWGDFGWSGVLRAAGVIFFAYIGFDAVSTAAQETRNPSYDLPFGLMVGLGICAILYVLMSATMTGLVPFPELNDAAPVVVALDAHEPLRWLRGPVIFGALAGLTSVVLILILGQARILLAMSRDGLLPPVLGRVHRQFRTPHIATAVTGVVAAIMAGLVPLNILAELVSIGTLMAFILVCASVLVLRYTRPNVPRPFRVPAPWFVCLAGVGFCLLMAVSLGLGTWIRLIVWMLIGIVVYFSYSRHHSLLHQQSVSS